ncbi:MAG: hypothetical protein R3213_00865 [Flavobacteriaceae bacterium]|nr:hypothetical protein [Flavobacteriaceae bacterium]
MSRERKKKSADTSKYPVISFRVPETYDKEFIMAGIKKIREKKNKKLKDDEKLYSDGEIICEILTAQLSKKKP